LEREQNIGDMKNMA